MSVRIAVVLAAAGILAACQPSAEEQLARAEQYFADAEYRAAVIEVKNSLRSDAENPDARLLLARVAFQLADFPTAETEYVRALELGRDHPDVWLGFGRTLMSQGKAAVALERVVPNLSSETDDVEVLVFLGDVYSALGNLGDAEAYYRQALAINVASDGALIGAAVIAEAQGDSVTARSYLDQAVEHNPNSALAWRAMGNFLRLRRDFDKAAEAYAHSIRVETPTTSVEHRFLTRANRATVLLDMRRLDEAAVQIDELSVVLPGHPLLYFLRGRRAYGAGEYDVAQMELQKYQSLMPGDLRGQAVLGAINFSQNHFVQAEIYLQRAARGNVGGETTRRLLAETQLRLNKPGDAMDSLQLVVQDGISDPMLLSMLGRAEIGLGNTDAAVQYFEQGFAADPTNPATSLSLANGLLAAGQYDRAIEVLDSVPDSDDSLYRRETLLIVAHMKNGDPDAAIAETERLIRDNADDSAAYSVAGVLLHSIGDADGARVHFEDAVRLDSRNIAAMYGLARLAANRSDAADTEKWLNQALDVDASFVPALIALSSILPPAGKYAELRSRFTAAIEANPQALAPRLLQARVAIVNSNFAEALDIVTTAKDFHPDEAKLVHAEGLALVGLGQTESGLRALANAANNDPDDASIQFDLAKIRIQVGDYRGALNAAARFRELRPEDVRGLALSVVALARTDQFDAAREMLLDYRTGHVDTPLSLMMAGDIEMMDDKPLTALGYYESAAELDWSSAAATRLMQVYRITDPDKALEPLERWLGEHPDDARMRRIYAQVLVSQGQADAGASEYERLIDDNSDDAIALNNLAWQYAEEGRDGAVELAQRAHDIQPNNGNISDTLGWILYRQGDSARALELLRDARRQSPNNPEIRFHLATVLAETGNENEANSELTELLRDNESFPSRELAEALARSL